MSTSTTQPATPEPDRNGLVQAPDDLLRAAPTKVLASLVVGFFLLVCAGGGVWDILDPAPVPYATGGERRQENRRRDSARVLDGTKMAVWTGDHQSISNIRATLVPWYVANLVHFLGEANDDMFVGKEDWIFRWDRLSPGPGPNDPRSPELAARILRAVERRMACLDLELLLLPLPRKAVIAAEYLPEGADPYLSFDGDVLARLKQWGLPHINLLKIFEGRTARELWYTQDTHWRQQAQLLTADAVQAFWNFGPKLKDRAARLVSTPTALARRSMLLSLGLGLTHPATRILPEEPGQRFALRRRSKGNKRWRLPPPATRPAWAVVGTSFTAGDQLVRLLSNHLGSTPYDASERGSKTLGSLGDRLERRADALPPLWLLEVPLYQFFYKVDARGLMAVGAEVFKFYRRTAQASVQTLHNFSPRKASDNTLLSVPRGALAHDGDAALILRLHAQRTPRRDLTLHLRQGDMRYDISWPKGAAEVDVPLLAHGRADGKLRLDCDAAKTLGAVGVELLTEYDVAGGIDTIETPPVADKLPKSWTQLRLFPEPQILDRHHALWLETEGLRNGLIRVELLPAEAASPAQPRKLGGLRVHSAGRALLYAGGPGGPFRGVRLSGRGALPKQTGKLRLVALPQKD